MTILVGAGMEESCPSCETGTMLRKVTGTRNRKASSSKLNRNWSKVTGPDVSAKSIEWGDYYSSPTT
jgi:hypothetical protein